MNYHHVKRFSFCSRGFFTLKGYESAHQSMVNSIMLQLPIYLFKLFSQVSAILLNYSPKSRSFAKMLSSLLLNGSWVQVCRSFRVLSEFLKNSHCPLNEEMWSSTDRYSLYQFLSSSILLNVFLGTFICTHYTVHIGRLGAGRWTTLFIRCAKVTLKYLTNVSLICIVENISLALPRAILQPISIVSHAYDRFRYF